MRHLAYTRSFAISPKLFPFACYRQSSPRRRPTSTRLIKIFILSNLPKRPVRGRHCAFHVIRKFQMAFMKYVNFKTLIPFTYRLMKYLAYCFPFSTNFIYEKTTNCINIKNYSDTIQYFLVSTLMRDIFFFIISVCVT